MTWILALVAVAVASAAAAPTLLFQLFLYQARALDVKPSAEDQTISYPLV